MKTLSTQNTNKSGLSALIFIIASTLFLTSCQKDELLAPSPQKGMEINHSEVSRTKANLNLPMPAFKMIVIDHSSAQTHQPSYRLEIISDGTVLFTGRKNLATIGERKFMISKQTLTNIRNMFIDGHFAQLESQQFILDLPSVETTFALQANSETITKIDNNSNNPLKLIQLRRTVENMLNISQLIFKHRDIINLEENMAQQLN